MEGTSLEVQWLRFYPPMYRAQVQSLVRKLRFPCAAKCSQKTNFYLKKIFFKTKIGPEREEELFNALKQRLRFFLEVGKRSSHALLNVNEDASWKDIKYRILNQNASGR